MSQAMKQTLYSAIVIASVLGCAHSAGKAAPNSQQPVGASTAPVITMPTPSALLPELAKADLAKLREQPAGAEILHWAREGDATKELPQTTYTLYRRFKLAGEREPYQVPYYAKRTMLTQAVLAAWLGQDFSDERLNRINDLLWSICEETTWVLPAHEKPEQVSTGSFPSSTWERGSSWTIDLYAAETATDLAHVLLVMGDHMPGEIQDRVRAEIKQRVMDPYLEHARNYWWNLGANNWTGVCAGSVGETFLLLEKDPARLNKAVALVLEQFGRFIDHGFEKDGGCLEGIGYWNYGLSHYVTFAEMLKEATAGKIDLLASNKCKLIAQYPLAVWLGNNKFASFADSHEEASMIRFLVARIAQRTGTPALMALPNSPIDWVLGDVLRSVLWFAPSDTAPPPLKDVFMPASGIAKLVGTLNGKPAALAIKAGHNAEPHNHNDIGSFVLCIDDVIYLCDPGAGLYNKDYFGPNRYDNIFANSYGHSVPRIGKKLQGAGIDHRGTLEKTGDKSVRVNFGTAYDIPTMHSAFRSVQVGADDIQINDIFEFDAPGLPVEEAFLTWLKVETNGPTAKIISDKGTLTIQTDQGTFSAERLEEACKQNHKKGSLTRVTVVYPVATSTKAAFKLTFASAQ